MAIRSSVSRERARRRRKLLARLTMTVAGAGIFIGIGYASYQSGSVLAARQVAAQQTEIDRLRNQLTASQVATERLTADLTITRQTVSTLQQRYDANVPNGVLASLVGIVRQKLAAGIKDDRLAQMLRDVEAPIPCATEKVARRRFPIGASTPANEDGTSFLDGLMQVSVSVPPNGDTKGAAVTITRAWTSQPIKLTGLPAQQIIPVYNTELKLTVEASDLKGFATASLVTCGRG